MLEGPILQEAHGPAGEAFEPFLPGLVILLPLLGFVLNGVLALAASRRSAAAVRAGGELDFFEGGKRPLMPPQKMTNRPTTSPLPW